MFAKTFRNSLLASSLLIGASLLVGPAAMAQQVTTTIDPINEVSFVPTTEGRVITPGEATTDYSLGALTIQNNHANGWDLKVTSANNGVLRFTANLTDYDIAYGNLSIDSTITGATVATMTPATVAATFLSGPYDASVAGGVTRTVRSTLNPGDLPAGTYTDTLTFTLSSNP